METLLVLLVVGLLATLLMVAVMDALVWEGFEHGDMIRFLGSDVTTNSRLFFPIGMAIYFVVGVLLAGIYSLVLDSMQFNSLALSIGFAGFMGFAQGFLLMHFFIEELGSHHPNAFYQRFWIPVSMAHWLGHLIYGLSVGSLIGAYSTFGLTGLFISIGVNLGLAVLVLFFARFVKLFHKDVLR